MRRRQDEPRRVSSIAGHPFIDDVLDTSAVLADDADEFHVTRKKPLNKKIEPHL